MQNFKILGIPTTKGELIKLIESFPDDTSFGFRNMPILELVETTDDDVTYVSFQYTKDDEIDTLENPIELEPVLAKINHVNDLGISSWHEVIFYFQGWQSYSGSNTFNDGEKVVNWKYCKDIF